jgi:multicomponent Na+:H+ antiporter subunit G
VFYFFGVAGLLRFPDVFMRIHAAGKVSALGIYGIGFGAAVLVPDSTFKVIILIVFMFVTQPVASHVVAQAAYRTGVAMYQADEDALAGKIEVRSTKEQNELWRREVIESDQ